MNEFKMSVTSVQIKHELRNDLKEKELIYLLLFGGV